MNRALHLAGAAQFKPTREPRSYQREALAKARGRKAFMFLMEMGMGKSKVAIDEVCQLYLNGEIDRVLIIAGKGSYADWTDKHLPENMPPDIDYIAHRWRGGSTKTEMHDIDTMMLEESRLRFMVMNVEAFGSSDRATQVAKIFCNVGRVHIICDESTKIRKMTAKRTQVACVLSSMGVSARAMTGLVAPKNPLDLWGQLTFLGIHWFFASNFWSFKYRYCKIEKVSVFVRRRPGDNGPQTKLVDKITGFQNIDELQAQLNQHSYRAIKEDHLDLPPKIYETYEVEPSPEQKRIYNDMRELAMAELAGGTFTSAKNAIGRLMKMHQILCGFVVDEQNQTHRIEKNGRIDALKDVLDETSGKVIIWCAYQLDVVNVLEALQQEYPDDEAVTYYGPTKDADRVAAVQKFQHGSARFFVGTAATGGYGITLTAAHTVVYYSNDFDLEHRMQSEDRAHRIGQEKSVTYVDLVVPRSVDVKILKTLRDKKHLAEQIMGDVEVGSIAKDWLEAL
jgi:SNF2 family DNA or RNA helicase